MGQYAATRHVVVKDPEWHREAFTEASDEIDNVLYSAFDQLEESAEDENATMVIQQVIITTLPNSSVIFITVIGRTEVKPS